MFNIHLLLAAGMLLFGSNSALGGAGPRFLLESEYHRSAKATVFSRTLTGGQDLELFKAMAKLAEEMFGKTGNLEAAVYQLRSAFLLCPSCRYDDFGGAKFREVFSIDMLPDRLYLTEAVFPAVQRMQDERDTRKPLQLLWAGSHPYTLRYEYLLKGVQMLSIDPNPDVAVYGSSHRHAVDVLQNLGNHVPPDTFDIAIVNGVLGWGINSEEEVKASILAVHRALKAGGYLIVGFNRHMTSCCRFEPYFEASSMGVLPPKKDFDGHWQHTFEIFKRRSLSQG